MHALTVIFGNNDSQKVFLFSSGLTAQKAHGLLTDGDGACQFIDDFGQVAYFGHAQVSAAFVEDMDRSMDALIELGLHQARTQAKGQTRAAADPTLKTAAMMQQNPMMMSRG